MSALERTIARAGRRAAIDLALLAAGRGVTIGVFGGLVLLALDRGTGLVVPLPAYPVLVGVIVAISVAVAIIRRPSGFDIAVWLDRRLDLKDRLGTGVAIRRNRAHGELTELASLDAQRVAATLDVRPATPIRVTGVWPVAVLLGAMLAAGIAYLPAFGAATAEPAVTRTELEAQRAQIVQTIDETLGDLDDETLDAATREDVETLERLAEQLAEPAADEVELARVRDESAAQMQEMADALAEQSRRSLEVVEEVTRRFAAADETAAPTRQPPADLDEFLDAMRRGDLDEAAERFDELVSRKDQLPAPTREEVARELRELSERLDPQRAQGDPETPDAGELERLREALDDLGVDEQTMREILDEQDRAQRDRALEEALNEAADEAPRQPPGEPPNESSTESSTEPRDESGERTPGERRADEETRRRIAEDLTAAREKQLVREQAGEQRDRLSKALEKAADDLQGQQQQPAEGQPQEPRQAEDRPTPPDQQSPRQGEQAPRPDQPDPSGARREQPGEQPGDTPDAKPIEQPGDTPGEQPSVSELLRQLQKAQQQAQGKQADSERLREAARKLADTMTDQQKQQLLEQWMQVQGERPDKPDMPPEGDGGAPAGQDAAGPGWQRDGPRPPAFEDIDLRDEQDQQDQQIIGEWLSDTPVEGAPAPAGSGGRAAVGRARSAAEQAIEKSVVPSRYHEIIRRYFGRLEKTVDPPPTAKPDAGGGT